MQRAPTDYVMWHFVGNDDCENLEFNTGELSMDEATARAASGALTVCQAVIRRRSNPKGDARELGKT